MTRAAGSATRRAHAILALVAALAVGPAPAAAGTCPIVDAIAPLAAVAAATAGEPDAQQITAYRQALIDAHPALYAPHVLGLEPGPAMDGKILASLAQTRIAPDHSALIVRVRTQIAETSRGFGRVFPDFKCHFPVYLTDSLGTLDGAGRVVDGQPAMVIGVDSVEQELPQLSLPVFLNHEFFHRYHFEAAGFSDDPAGNQEIWRVLWAEGLATYFSKVLSVGATTADALLSAHLEERARPLMPQIAADLLTGMDRIDSELFDEYFRGGPWAGRHGLPARSGYYVGYVVAGRLAERHSLAALAHLKGAALHDEIAATLRALATNSAVARGP